jgi:uncharacterized protein (TIGR02186 family)
VTRFLFAISVVLTALLAGPAPASAERIIASLSNHRVMVTSNFTGGELVLFGTIEREAGVAPRTGGYDVVVTVIGPRQNLVTFRKDRVLGIWVNVDSRVFEDAPAYLAVLSNRPLEAIANAETLRRLQIGLANVVLLQRAAATIADSDRNDPFRVAFIDLRSRLGLYREQTNGVTFLTSDFFRASVPLPAEAPVGDYQVDVKLFSAGAVIARTDSAFEVYKSGLEQAVSAAAHDHGFLYGLATALMALATGWFASVVFRKD